MTSATIHDARIELGKFFKMFGDGVKGLNMPSQFIDSVWHDLLHLQEEYKEFCQKHASQYVNHSQDAGQGSIDWVQDYEARFGQLPVVWFMDENGKLNQHNYNHYKATGKWIDSWRCGPKKN